MTTVSFNDVNFDLVFIDPTIASAGDGSTAATALSDLPSSLSDGKAYIFRRTSESNYAIAKRQVDTSIHSLAFIGFPKPNDEWYSLMPADAKSAWGSDTADYGIVVFEIGDYQTLRFDQLKTFIVDGMFMSKHPSQNYRGHMVKSENSSYDHQFFVKNSRFGCIGYDFSTLLVGDHSVEIPTSPYNVNHYFRINGSPNSLLALTNCNIDASVFGNADYVYSERNIQFQLLGYVNLFLKDVNVFISSSSKYDSNYSGAIFYKQNGEATVIEDCNFYSFANDHQRAYLEYFIQDMTNLTKINNLLVKYIKTPSDITTELRNRGQGWNSAGFSLTGASFQGSNIFFDFTESSIRYKSRLFAVKRDYATPQTLTNPSRLENIRVYFNPEGTIESPVEESGFDQNVVVSFGGAACNENYISEELRARFEISDLDVRTYIREASNRQEFNYSRAALGIYKAVTIENGRVLGPIKYLNEARASQVHLSKLENNCSLYPAIMYYETSFRCNLLMIDDLDSSYTEGSNISCLNVNNKGGYAKNSFYIKKSNVALTDLTSVNMTENDNRYYGRSVICPDLQGRYFQRNRSVFCVSWNTLRSGSDAQASLKLWCDANTQSRWDYLTVGGVDFKSFEVTTESSGPKKLRVHLAISSLYTNISDCKNNIWFTLKYLVSNGKGGTQTRVIDSRASCVWKDDVSTWSGDSNVVSKVIEIPFDGASADTVVEVKPSFYWPSALGYIYLDPVFEIVDAN